MSVFNVCTDYNSCIDYNAPDPWYGEGFYDIIDGASYNPDYGGEFLLIFNGSVVEWPNPYLTYGPGYYTSGGCIYGCEDPNSPMYHSYCELCSYNDCAENAYYPALGETCNNASKDYFGVCCGGCYDLNACSSSGGGCDYGYGSASCGCNNTDLGCGCGGGWNGSLPSPSQVLSGVSFSEGQFSFTGTLEPGVAKSKVILSAALGIPIL